MKLADKHTSQHLQVVRQQLRKTIKQRLKRDKSIKRNYTLFAELILYQTWLQHRISIELSSGSLFYTRFPRLPLWNIDVIYFLSQQNVTAKILQRLQFVNLIINLVADCQKQ